MLQLSQSTSKAPAPMTEPPLNPNIRMFVSMTPIISHTPVPTSHSRADSGRRQQSEQVDHISDFYSQSQPQPFGYSLCKLRHLQPSILNKSSIHSVNLTDSKVDELPNDLPTHTQKLDISRNLIWHIKGLERYQSLKQLKIDYNIISQLPAECLRNMKCLRILRANNNRIRVLPYLPHLRHLQLNNNPISLITTRLSQTRLQYLSFDWMPFLINIILENNDQDIFYALCDIVKEASEAKRNEAGGIQVYNTGISAIHLTRQASNRPIDEYIDFASLFEHRKIQCDISYLLYKALTRSHNFFIQYLLKYQNDLNYNLLLYNDKLILQETLQQKNQLAMQLYKLKRSNLNQPAVFILNLIMACKYNNYQFFTYLTANGLKRQVIQENQEEVIQTIFRNFQETMRSGQMLQKVLTLAGFDRDNMKVFKLPVNYSLLEAQNICQGLSYTMKDPELNKIIDFSQAVQGQNREPLLHFSMTYRKPELVKLILTRYKKPFIRNGTGKQARTIRGSIFSRKLVWKYQKNQIKNRIQSQSTQSQVNKRRSLVLDNQKWFDIVCNGSGSKGTIFSSPFRKSKKQRKSLMSSRIQSVQKQITLKNTINRLKMQRQSQIGQQSSPLMQFSQNFSQLDQTGIVSDFIINLTKKTSKLKLNSNNIKNLISPSTNSLTLYQLFQNSLLEDQSKDYKIRRLRPSSSSFFSTPWRICTDVQDLQSQGQYILERQGNKTQNYEQQEFYQTPLEQVQQLSVSRMNSSVKKKFIKELCTTPCLQCKEVSNQSEIEVFRINQNQKFIMTKGKKL